MADAFRADRGVVAGMLERDPAKLPLLRAAHRHAQFHLDYEDTSWASFSWSNGALRVVLGGLPCQPVVPTGKRLGIGDPRSAASSTSSGAYSHTWLSSRTLANTTGFRFPAAFTSAPRAAYQT
jgi:hypothetical protein